MNDSVPDDLLEINDPEIDAAALMAQIRERMRQRRIALGLDDRSFPSYDVTSCPPEPEDIAFDANLYHHLRLANELYAQGETEPALPPSPIIPPHYRQSKKNRQNARKKRLTKCGHS